MRTLINVCGSSYSGTTMLDLMLGNAPGSASCGEVGAWFRPKRVDRLDPACPCGARPCSRWAAVAGVPEHRFHRQAADAWGVATLVDSTKRLSWVVDANRWGARSGFRVVNLLIWKDPATHAYSHWKRGTPLRMARRRFVRYHRRFLGLGLPFAAVHYDDFARDPAGHLARACRVAGVEYRPGQEDFWARKHHNLYGNGGTRDQLGRPTGSIRPPGPFPEAFHRELDEFERGRGADARCRRVVDALRGADVADADPRAFDRPGPGLVTRYWYYEDIAKQACRDLFGRLRPARSVGAAVARASTPARGAAAGPVAA